MVDSGAQVSCVSYSLLGAFPEFQAYYHSAPDTVKGVGGVSCHVCGELREVPLSLGEDQASGSVVRCTFRVIPKEEQYQIIFGLDFLVPLGAKLYLREAKMTYWRGAGGTTKQEVTLKLYKRTTVRLQPAAKMYRRHVSQPHHHAAVNE